MVKTVEDKLIIAFFNNLFPDYKIKLMKSNGIVTGITTSFVGNVLQLYYASHLKNMKNSYSYNDIIRYQSIQKILK